MKAELSYGIGEQLKVRRDTLGYTLAEVAQQTRIRKVYLAHIEADEFEALPGAAYVNGFVRVYARFLGLPDDPLIAALNLEGVPSQSPSSPDLDSPADSTILAEPAHPSKDWPMFFLGLLIVLVLGSALYFLIDGNELSTQKVPAGQGVIR